MKLLNKIILLFLSFFLAMGVVNIFAMSPSDCASDEYYDEENDDCLPENSIVDPIYSYNDHGDNYNTGGGAQNSYDYNDHDSGSRVGDEQGDNIPVETQQERFSRCRKEASILYPNDTIKRRESEQACLYGNSSGTLASNKEDCEKFGQGYKWSEVLHQCQRPGTGNNSNPPVNTVIPDPPKQTMTVTEPVSLDKYCDAQGKDGNTGGFVSYDGACGKDGEAFGELTSMTNKVLKWIVRISLLIAAALAFYGGWLYIASATDPSARSKANSIFKGIAIGLFIIYTAWMMVKFVLFLFVKNSPTTNDINAEDNYTGLQE